MKSGRRGSKSLQLLRLPDELLIEILSWLPVKSLLQFRCVSKLWNSLISDSQFVKLHLHRSIFRSTDFAHTRLLIKCHTDDLGKPFISSRTVSSLLETHPVTVGTRRSFLSGYDFIGTCNGLISMTMRKYDKSKRKYFSEVCFWNPATRRMSQLSPPLYPNCMLGFGYDCSSDTYKVVGVTRIPDTMVNVYNMGDNCWRTIQVPPLPTTFLRGPAVYASNTVNWLATPLLNVLFPKDDDMDSNKLMDIDSYFIVSFDLGKEEYAQQLSLPCCPRRKKEFIDFRLNLGVLNGCLCISQNNKETHNFVLWQMKEFGVHESWTQLFNIIVDENILHLQMKELDAVCMSENGDALLFADADVPQAVLYNQRDNKLQDTIISNKIVGSFVKNYIESLVSPS